MKTEKEIREKYEEMLKHTELLMDKLNNPDKYDDVNMENIQEYINSSYEQHHLNALMRWVLDESDDRKSVCNVCNGDGIDDSNFYNPPCGRCKGTGKHKQSLN